ncbi:MAG: hypothetical protein HC840_00325 [Leptolyngbyaceae cyanobacterium RM2_2_4]|nr:hypothetical protein [Leptolyngbyaceae cyanobacterium RM2_2_4]
MSGIKHISTTPVASSVPFDNSTNGFAATDTQAAIEEAKLFAQGFPRAGVRCTANGTVGNNDWIGPNELLSNTPMATFPVKVQINEISWANQNTNVEFRIQFRSGSKTGTIFYTLTVTPPNSGSGFVSGLSFEFPAGTTIWAQYLDDGQNMSDADIMLWISRVP